MSNDQLQKQSQPVEGEGSYSATRRYNQHLGEAIDGGDLEAGAAAAREALEGPEREALERAAAEAKRGPKPSQSAPSATNQPASNAKQTKK